jgi:hypothetical protein
VSVRDVELLVGTEYSRQRNDEHGGKDARQVWQWRCRKKSTAVQSQVKRGGCSPSGRHRRVNRHIWILTRPDPTWTPYSLFSRTTATLRLVISLRRSCNLSLGLEETVRTVRQPVN